VTGGFLRHLQGAGKKPTSINRGLATLRHCAGWLHRLRPFLAGNPFDRIGDLQLDDPEWKGLSSLEVTRLCSAAEQLLMLKTGKNQLPIRDHAIFLVLLNTGLRVSELLDLDLAQYEGKHFLNVKRKGKKVTRSVFLPRDARDALDLYVKEVRDAEAGPLFCSRQSHRLARQNVDVVLKEIAARANAKLPEKERISLSAHILRHTMLRRVTEQRGVHYAMELAGHTSSNYIWRYVQPSDEEKEKALEDLF
jgi:integrase/recombinase XerD